MSIRQKKGKHRRLQSNEEKDLGPRVRWCLVRRQGMKRGPTANELSLWVCGQGRQEQSRGYKRKKENLAGKFKKENNHSQKKEGPMVTK